MTTIRHLTTLSTAASAIILAILPIVVAIDFGGVLWWTQYVAALAILVAFCLALPTLLVRSSYDRPRQMLLLVPLLLWLIYSAFQIVRLPPAIVNMISPASYQAYTDWLAPVLPAELLPQSFPISIAVDDSTHAVALFGILFALAWTSLRVFNTRARVIGLLSAVAITGAVISVLGIVSLTLPGLPFFESITDSDGSGFATFVNRNNAALTLNFGLAASLGLLGWRLSALTGQEIDGDEFEFGELFALASDRDSIIGIACAVLCVVGLLICGSRGGLGTAILATTISFGWMRKRRGLTTIPVVLAVVAIASALLIVPLQLDLESIKRLEVLSSDTKTLANDGRLEHWPEGWDTAVAHLPGGSGFSTYAYAYLPHQTSEAKNWFVHADNLWLELLAEQGVVGITLTLTLLIALGWCLTTISVSHDALDHGIRITGWYCLTAIVFSQFFDFGLIIPANLILFVLLMGAVVSRSSEADVLLQINPDSPTLLSKIEASQRLVRLSAILAPIVGLAAIAVSLSSVFVLQADASLSTAVRTSELRIAQGQANTETLDLLSQQFKDLPPDQSSVGQLMMQANISHRMARLAEVIDAKPTSSEQATELYRVTSPKYRRLAGQNASDYIEGLPASLEQIRGKQDADGYLKATQLYQRSLLRLPLDPTIRGHLVTLDFASSPSHASKETNENTTRTLITQLGKLHRGHPSQLRDVAELAAQSRLDDLAAQLWNESLIQMPAHTASVMRTIQNYKHVDLLSALPDTPQVMRLAANEIVVRRKTNLFPVLDSMVEKLDCENCESINEKSECLRLKGKSFIAMENLKAAAESLSEAVTLSPSNASLRMELIATLRESGDQQAALQQARVGRQITPDDKRFDNVIKQMAALDVEIGPNGPPKK